MCRRWLGCAIAVQDRNLIDDRATRRRGSCEIGFRLGKRPDVSSRSNVEDTLPAVGTRDPDLPAILFRFVTHSGGTN